uniref:Protein pellino n=1 Tax=Panagrellus redivivus TaxID=6233 RepID=A0A7E5A0E6_PANRE
MSEQCVVSMGPTSDVLVKTICNPVSMPTVIPSLDSGKLSETENDSPESTPTHAKAILEPLEQEPDFYGELILLGYNGSHETTHKTGRYAHRSKMTVRRRDVPNGVKKGGVVAIQAPPSQSSAVQDVTRHVVSYSYNKEHTVLVEYLADPTKDLFQVGRSSEPQIDFCIVDTWLVAGPHAVVQSPVGGNNNYHGTRNNRPVSSTISRFACRCLADRENSDKVYVYAAGFDSSRNIFLGEKATKWQKKNGDYDGLTTNGVLILHPNREESSASDASPASTDSSQREMYEWREVSVDGDIYSLRETRSSQKRGSFMPDETNELQDGTLIDLCGATLLWRSAEGLKHSPSRRELERRLDELNAGKPQCPVNLNTLIIPKKRAAKGYSTTRQPYVYVKCGHVQGKHDWGVTRKSGDNTPLKFKCPICICESDKVIELTMGMESAFHLDSEALEYAFNPCGHVASHRTVQYWSRIPLPHGTNSFHPVCPFCTSLLNTKKPYIRLIFQDHCDF